MPIITESLAVQHQHPALYSNDSSPCTIYSNRNSNIMIGSLQATSPARCCNPATSDLVLANGLFRPVKQPLHMPFHSHQTIAYSRLSILHHQLLPIEALMTCSRRKAGQSGISIFIMGAHGLRGYIHPVLNHPHVGPSLRAGGLRC